MPRGWARGEETAPGGLVFWGKGWGKRGWRGGEGAWKERKQDEPAVPAGRKGIKRTLHWGVGGKEKEGSTRLFFGG